MGANSTTKLVADNLGILGVWAFENKALTMLKINFLFANEVFFQAFLWYCRTYTFLNTEMLIKHFLGGV